MREGYEYDYVYDWVLIPVVRNHLVRSKLMWIIELLEHPLPILAG